MIYTEFEDLLYENLNDLSSLQNIINELLKNKLDKKKNDQANHLTSYFVIRACGTIEQCLKMLFFCHFKNGTTNQFVLNYLEQTLITKNSKNPSQQMINDTIKTFDDSRKFNVELKNMCKINLTAAFQQLDSLRNLRNQIAHGDRVTTVFSDITSYLDSCVILILEIKHALNIKYR